ncbi:hypothetical protein M1L60_04430 [Actinoplanes sp. TRM 88003]|uniref:Uncharacterized protein n=1 Tax=Paractinoplanes aksuensis TaxID=2939490 RepID=A0ABT1DG82_9ACTN|nr:hypothetical protein [Actinoplanes aksuensis]
MADSRTLPPADAARLRLLMSSLDFASLRSTRHPTGGADLFQYDLTLIRGSDHWRGTVSQASVPAALQPLLQFLAGRAASG